jgi:hypothetical protein
MTIWHLARIHHDHHCVDTRDRVFGLLSFTSFKNRGSIRADYTKSNLQVLLQLVEQESHAPGKVVDEVEERGDRFYLVGYLNVIGGFLLGPLAAEIAAMVRLRRESPPAILGPRPLTRGQYVYTKTQHRVVLEVLHWGTICEDENGNKMVSFSKGDEKPMHVGNHHDSRHVEPTGEAITVKVQTPMGSTSALASKTAKAGDSILILRDQVHGPRAPFTGLVVRPFDRDKHIIVGQVVVSDDFSSIVPDWNGHLFYTVDPSQREWLVFMSPEDLILFAAQDLKSEISSPKGGVGPTIVLSVCPEEQARRLTTSVTSDLVSSFAIRRQKWFRTRWEDPSI